MGIYSFVVDQLDRKYPNVALLLRTAKYRLKSSAEMSVMRQYVKDGDLVLDIGARRGLFTAYLLGLVGKRGNVEAFEPFPPNVAALREMFAQKENVKIHPIALSSVEGEAQFVVQLEHGRPNTALGSLEHTGASGETIAMNVSCRRLDNVMAVRNRRISFIKCDVEGHELAVVQGGDTLIAKDRPVVLMEIEQRHTKDPIASRFDFFLSLGYKAFFITADGDVRPIAEFSVDKYQRVGHRDYANMFLFLPNSDLV